MPTVNPAAIYTYLHSHYWRAVRTFMQTFGAVIVASWISNGSSHGIVALYDAVRAQWDTAAGTGFLAFLGALGWKPGLAGGKGDPQDPSLPTATAHH